MTTERSKALAIVQARMGSSRFPGKSMADLKGKPVIWHLFEQMQHAKNVERVILATSDRPGDDVLADYAKDQGWACFRGSETDLLERYVLAAQEFGANDETPVIRLTGDDIFSDPNIIDGLVELYWSLSPYIDVVYTDEDHLPYGGGASLFAFRALAQAHAETDDAFDREHVGPYIFKNPGKFPCVTLSLSADYSGDALSIDEPHHLDAAADLLARVESRFERHYHLSEVLSALGVKRQNS